MLPLLLLIHAVRAMAPPRKYAGPGFRVVRCFPKLSRRDSFGKQRTTRKPGPVYLLGGAIARTACMRTRISSIAAAACAAAAVLHLLQRAKQNVAVHATLFIRLRCTDASAALELEPSIASVFKR